MAAECFILSHDNIFNKAVLGENAIYYNDEKEIAGLLNNLDDFVVKYKKEYIENNLELIRSQYSWEKLVDEHEKYFQWILEDSKNR